MGLFVRKLRAEDGSVAGAQVSRRGDFSAPPPEQHHFSPNWVMREVATGLVSMADGKIVIHTGPKKTDVVEYEIVRTPGAYCLHCGDRVGDGPATTPEEVAARIHYVEICEVFNNDDETGDLDDPVNRYAVYGGYLGELIHG